MNIFFIDRDPCQAATWLVDRHVSKMILEGVQLMSTCHRVLDGDVGNDPVVGRRMHNIYRMTHVNHPMNVWIRESVPHYMWLFKHTEAMSWEFSKRFGGCHKSTELLLYLNAPPINLTNTEWCDPPMCMPDTYKRADVVDAYRAYYTHGKQHLHRWKIPSSKPWWI